MTIDAGLSHTAGQDDRVTAQLEFYYESAHSRVPLQVSDPEDDPTTPTFWGEFLFFFTSGGTFVPSQVNT